MTVFGNPQEGNEELYATELGYRQEFGTHVSIDLTAFFNQYISLRSAEPMAPYFESNPSPPHLIEPIVFANLLFGETHGAEASINWRVSSRWTLSPGYSFLTMHLHPRPTSNDIGVPEVEGSSPTHQAQLRSNLNLPGHFQFDTSAFFVEGLPSQNVPPYTRLDAGMTWHPLESFTVSLVGQNMLADHHLEANNTDQIVLSSLIKRSGYAKITWSFK